jgi:para-nitrobenzyl esterase
MNTQRPPLPQNAAMVLGMTVLAALSACKGAHDKTSSPDASAGSVDGGQVQGMGSACPIASSTDPLVVATDKGLVKGIQAGSGFAFLGIPFAQPPTGALRFMPPVAASCWPGVVDATSYGHVCAQFDPSTGAVIGSEDCLTLNVWTPALPQSSESKQLPVLVWDYGGGGLIGASSLPYYDGQTLANANNAVVVTFNYRMGVLGFLAHPALTAANPQHTSGNYGLLDAVLVLQWVQDNIAAFGGDKTQVMLFGQSSGAINTCALLASPLTHGLFSSALMESGNCAAETLAQRYTFGEDVATSVDCAMTGDVAGCLQSAPLAALVRNGGIGYIGGFVAGILSGAVDPAHVQDLPFAPTVDGYVLDATPLATIQAGNHNHVPLVIGTNSAELAAYVPTSLFPSNAIEGCAEYAALVALFTKPAPALAQPMLAAYSCNLTNPSSGYNEFVADVGDAFLTCPSRRALRAAAAAQTEPVYRYLFTHGPSGGPAGHGDEVPFVFGTFAAVSYSPSAAEDVLASQMQSYWVNLAATGNPNGSELPTWSAYDPSVDNALRLDMPISDTSAIEMAGCNFWDSVQ